MSLTVMPRRHGKSTLFALIVLWLHCSRNNFTVQLLGNSEAHSRRVQFNTLVRIIRHTPALRLMIPEKSIRPIDISFPKRGNVIQRFSGVNTAASFGDRFNVLWASDLHAAVDLGPWNALQASLLDSQQSMILVDSNVDFVGGHVHALQHQAEHDPGIFCHHTEYRDFDHFAAEAPTWIDRDKARRLQNTVLEADFKRDILGQRSSVVNSLFPPEVLEQCRDCYRAPVADIKALVGDRSYVIGGGLDRADSEWGSVFGNDNSIFTTVAKVADPENGEPVIYVLDAHLFRPSSGRAIKRHILKMHEKYHFTNVTLESHNVSDIAPYLVEQGVPVETVSPHTTTQNSAWPELVRLAKTGRLRISTDLTELYSELSTMTYSRMGSGNYRFGAAAQSQHDDYAFSLLWAVYSLRNEILQLYALPHVQCMNKSSRRKACYIFGGSLELLCGEQCPAHQQVKEFYRQFLQYQTESALTLPEFYHHYVTVKGALLYQAA